MANSSEHPTITLHYTGLFDFDGLYVAVVDWAKNYGYMWYERSYKHKVPNPKGAEQELDWLITKKVTDYIGFEIWFQIHTWDQTEVEVEVDGKKKTLTNARIHLTMNGKVIYDRQGRFAKGNRFAQMLGDWYSQYIYKREIETYWDQLYYRMWNLHAILKKYFEMQTQKFAYKGYLKEH
ncbi:hypothetical protein HYU22_03925 [Candidatus Woesearchaeota archaeon]|nr:hypothetical protein [Candidatus Woesearchaeota archaeon]